MYKQLTRRSRFAIPDNMPDSNIPTDAIAVHSYCMTWDKKRLSEMTRACTARGIEIKQEMDSIEGVQTRTRLLLSNAYPGLEDEEADFKDIMLTEAGINPDEVTHVMDITNTYDETERIRELLTEIGAESLLVIADQHHMPRSLKVMRDSLPKRIEIYNHSVATQKHEITREVGGPLNLVGLIKSFRLGFKTTWIAWNFMMQKMNRLFAKK